MCFSDEPMIAIYGQFSIRLEDSMYITQDGARLFSKPSPAIDQPFGRSSVTYHPARPTQHRITPSATICFGLTRC
jgi:hypothetical protein